jgi:ArsR family metal-binding transcriptional regulator
LVTTTEGRAALAADMNIVDAGWVDWKPPVQTVPPTSPPSFSEDIFGTASVVYVAPCVADLSKIRLVAHLSGDVTEVLPYLNAALPGAFYNPEGQTLTLMDRHRMVVLYPRRATVAKADEIVDAWRTLEALRVSANETWSRRSELTPSYEMRQKPPALEIYRRLPGTNCGQCGEKTCMAFALRIWIGELEPSLCKPVYEGEHAYRRQAFQEICAGLGSPTRADGG